MAVAFFDQFTLTDVVLIAGIAGYLVDRFIDGRGWSRSSKTLRRENEDLVRRNTELEQTVGRLEQDVAKLKAEVSVLRVRDQAAVLRALDQHEARAGERHERTLEVLKDIRDVLKGGGA